MTPLQQIKDDIADWNVVRTNPSTIELLTTGYGFTISKQEYLNWLQLDPAQVYCYLAIHEGSLHFYLTDSVTDSEQTFIIGENLFRKAFYRILHPSQDQSLPEKHIFQFERLQLSSSVAERRIVHWMLTGKAWFESTINDPEASDQIARVFEIPFEDLTTLFSDYDGEVTCLLGLKTFMLGESEQVNMELILSRSQTDQSTAALFADVTRPCPPFGKKKEFNLL
jgi:hypothetical protein